MNSLNVLPGLRFTPTGSEIITEYLVNILHGSTPTFTAALITDFNVYTTEPWKLPMEFEYGVGSEAYYFTERPRMHGGKGKRVARRAGAGTWKATGSDTPVKNERGEVVGHVMHLCYIAENESSSSNWVMDEYRLLAPPLKPELENWAICRIKLNPTAEKKLRNNGGS